MRAGVSTVEKYYGLAFRSVLKFINTIKKRVYINDCKVHQFINNQSLRIIYENGCYVEHGLLEYYIKDLNKGVVWADQDFKSIGHFYNPLKQRGLYGHYNALSLAQDYYKLAIKSWKKSHFNKAMFYLGACVHLVQDVTIPQHVNIRLLDKHRKFETYVKKIYKDAKEYRNTNDIVHKDSIESYVIFNANNAINIYNTYCDVSNDSQKFHSISLESMALAQKTTAGCLMMFLNDVNYSENMNNIKNAH
ncbi:zinc dependent phospholipase C family protein [Clostridiaceae bacterium M8S5]|nr:zinc dependent phospholipase C family protein [Clostridiaceae bacterium M8S5]